MWLAGNDQSVSAAYSEAAKAYMAKNPNVTVNINLYSWGEYFTKLSTSFVGGTGPDVYSLGLGQYYAVSRNDYMLSLDNLIPQNWDGYTDISQALLDMCKVDGKLVALPVPEGRAIFYRKDIARQNGVTDADLDVKNLDDFINLAKKMTIKENGKTVMAGFELNTVAGNSTEQHTFIFGRMEGADWYWRPDLSGNFNAAGFVSGLKKTKTLLDGGYVLLQTPGIYYFNTDAAAMTISTTAGIEPQLAQLAELGGEVGIIPLPKGSNLLMGQYYAVNKSSKQPQAAVDFLLYLNSVEAETILAEKLGQTPNRKSIADVYTSGNPLRKVYFDSLMNDAVTYGNGTANPFFLNWINDFRIAVESVYTDGKDPQKALDDFMPKYNAVIGK
ncbi:sugar ABC transporter substrate-binding protein [Spirochaetia bacterium]|nr:sugar ABC transporter substrate-binding protein [Spirochaetia bacterium]